MVGIRFSSDAITHELSSELTADADPAAPPNLSVLVGGDAAAGSTGKHLLYSQGHLVGAFRSAETLEAAMLRAIGELALADPDSLRLEGIPVLRKGRAAIVDSRLAGELDRAERRLASAGIEVARGVRSVAVDPEAQTIGIVDPSAVLRRIGNRGDQIETSHRVAAVVAARMGEHPTAAERLAQLMPLMRQGTNAQELERFGPLSGCVLAPQSADAVRSLLKGVLLS